MHTNVSDGTYMPRDLVALAKEKHLQAISITDHDEVGAYAQLTANDRTGIQIFHGCEFSTYYHEKEVHVLGYQFSLDHPELQDYISHFKEVRRSRIHKMVDKCADAGYDISYEELVNTFTDAVSFGRPHIAQLLIAHGYVETVGEAFDTMLNPKGPCFVPKEKYEPQQAIDLIHRAGGIAAQRHRSQARVDTVKLRLNRRIRFGQNRKRNVLPRFDLGNIAFGNLHFVQHRIQIRQLDNRRRGLYRVHGLPFLHRNRHHRTVHRRGNAGIAQFRFGGIDGNFGLLDGSL